jgi:hypothetical protein
VVELPSSQQSAAERANASSSASRNGKLTVRALVDPYMAAYAGRDPALAYRLTRWCGKLGDVTLDQIRDDHVHDALEALALQPGRYGAGTDAHGRPIMKAKRGKMSAATLNRYTASLGGLLTWAIRRRIAPRGFEHAVRRIERRREDNERVRFLSTDERGRRLDACRRSKWPRHSMASCSQAPAHPASRCAS